MFLIFDSNHFEQTGHYRFKDKNGNQFDFPDALAAKQFVDNFYRNPVAAIFAYEFVKHYGQTNCLDDLSKECFQ